MSRYARVILACLLFCLFLFQVAAVREYGSDGDDSRILLAYEKTSFKNALVKELVDQLKGMGYLRVVDHNRGELDDENDAEYDAIVIINSGVNSRVRPRVSSWLNTAQNPRKIILLTTYRDRGWKPKYPSGVDGISSPSRKDAVDNLVKEITEKVQRLTTQR